MQLAQLIHHFGDMPDSRAIAYTTPEVRYEFIPPTEQDVNWYVVGEMPNGSGSRIRATRVIDEMSLTRARDPDGHTAQLMTEINRELLQIRNISPQRRYVDRMVMQRTGNPRPGSRQEEIFIGGRRAGRTYAQSQHLARMAVDLPADTPLFRRITEELQMPETQTITPFEGSWADTIARNSIAEQAMDILDQAVLDTIAPQPAPRQEPWTARIEDPVMRREIEQAMANMVTNRLSLRRYTGRANNSFRERMPRRKDILFWGKNRTRLSNLQYGYHLADRVVYYNPEHGYEVLNLQNGRTSTPSEDMLGVLCAMASEMPNECLISEYNYRKLIRKLYRRHLRNYSDLTRQQQNYSIRNGIERDREIERVRQRIQTRHARATVLQHRQAFLDAGFSYSTRNDETEITLKRWFDGFQFMTEYFVPLRIEVRVKYKTTDDAISMESQCPGKEEYYHPHVSNNSWCMGSYPDDMKLAFKTGDAEALRDMIFQIMNGFNKDSPYWHLNRLEWPLVLHRPTNRFVEMQHLIDFAEDYEDEDEEYDEDRDEEDDY